MKFDICLKRLYRLPQSPYQRLTQHRLLVTSQSLTPSSILTGEPTEKSTIDREAFIFGDKSSFVSCGLSPQLLSALSAAGKSIPTVIQAKSFPAIESGQNVVVGAETGSGKTLAYLLPIINGILKKFVERSSDEEVMVRSYPSAIIMVPNKELCNQVCRMANEVLCHLPPSPHNVSIGSFTNIMNSWPYAHSKTSPQIAVCTPAFLANFVRGPIILEEELFFNLEQLVLDEADMLLDGSYQSDMEKVFSTFRIVRKSMIKRGRISADKKGLQNIVVAATIPTYGLKSVEQQVNERFPTAIRVTNHHLHKHHPCIEQTFIKTQGILTCAARVDLVAKSIRGTISRNAVVTDTIQPISVPTVLDSNAAAESEVSPHDTASESVSEVREQVKEQVQTMVFVNTSKGAIALAGALRKVGVACAEYHTGITDPQRQENLRGFRVQEVSVLICTDHASRGLDLPHVRHVIQAEFATNVVQYLHRVGRASRAGVLGRATNIYDSGSEILVASILNDSDENKVDQSFSRRRSFRKKLKKSLKADDGSDDDGETESSISDPPSTTDLTPDVFIK